MSVGDDELDAGQTAGDQRPQQCQPAGAVLGSGDAQAEDLAVPVGVDADRDADLAIAEAAARLVPRARAVSERAASAAAPGRDKPKESVPVDAGPSGDVREINSPSAHAPLTQTAPDEVSEAE